MKAFESLLAEKEICKKNLNDSKRVYAFYKKLKNFSFKEFEDLFPAHSELIAQEVFDYTNEILAKPALSSAIDVSVSMFHPDTLTKNSDDNFLKDMQLLQALFFFFIKEISDNSEKDYSSLFQTAISDKSWREPEKQAQIINELLADMDAKPKLPIKPVDFCKLGEKHFKINESILRLFYNFMHPSLYAKEGIINELNFVREQQKNILPVIPNTKKTNYKTSAAKEEIRIKNDNLKKLKELDSGFSDKKYAQSFFFCDEKFKNSFIRPVICKCFSETDLQWEKEPEIEKRNSKTRIIARKSDRAANNAALNHKYLYSERNIITHVSENNAVYKLFGKEYSRYETRYWEELIFESMYDARQYILKMKASEPKKMLLAILNHYFTKITENLKKDGVELKSIPVEKRWELTFDDEGNFDLEAEELKKANIYNIFDEDEITHFKRFMGFIYCSENDESDFFERNRTRIQLYLIYLSLNFSMIDK